MEHIEKNPHYFFTKMKMVLNDSELAVEYGSLFMKQNKKYQYKDIKPDFGTGSVGGVRWSNLGGLVFCIGLIFCIITLKAETQDIRFAGITVFLVSILAALVFFVIRCIKHKCVFIYDKYDSFIVSIRVTDASKDFIEEFQKRVELANKKET